MTEYAGTYGVIGPPGTGKTTFLASQVRAIVEATHVEPGSSPVLVSSLTKTAAAEIGGRGLPIPREAVGTLHAHAFHGLGRPSLVEGSDLSGWNSAFADWPITGGETRGRADELDGETGEIVEDGRRGDELKATYDLLRARMVPRESWDLPELVYVPGSRVRVDELSRFVDAYEDFKTSAGLFDFTDLIGAGLSIPPPLDPRVIVVDEVQDLSALEWELVRAWSSGRALFAVGDPWQSLYKWRGAAPELFDSIPAERLKVLGQSYRVPERIVRTSLAWMNGRSNVSASIEYRPRRGEDGEPVPGEIHFENDWTSTRVSSLVAAVESSLRAGRSVMIEATCSYVLGPTIAALREAGVPFANPWRRKRGDWNPIGTRGTSTLARFAAFLAPGEPGHGLWTWKELAAWGEIAVRTFRRNAKSIIDERAKSNWGDQRITSIELAGMLDDPRPLELGTMLRERGLCDATIDAARGWFAEHVARNVGSGILFASKVIRRFGLDAARTEPKCYVGTIHSFKGAEADDVFLLPDISSRALASVAPGSETGESVNAIARTIYVGMTRARERLVVLGSASKADRAIFDVSGKILECAIESGAV